MFTRKTYLSGLQFAVYFALIAQGMLAMFFNTVTPNIYKVIVTPGFLKSCAWIKNMYPGYLEHSEYYAWFLALMGVLVIYAAVAKMNIAGYIRTCLKGQPLPYRQFAFAAALSAGILAMSSLVLITMSFLARINGSPGINVALFLNETSFIVSAILFLILFSLLRLQWRNKKEHRTVNDQSPLFFSASISFLFSLLCYLLQTWLMRLFTERISCADCLEYIFIHHTPVAIAVGSTIAMAAIGFISGLALSLVSFDAAGDQHKARKKELVAFLTLLAVTGGALGVFSQKILKEKFHFFTSFDSVISLTEVRGIPRKAVIFSDGNTSDEIDMTLDKTLFTEENMASLSRYLSRYGTGTKFSDAALARLADRSALDWDVPGALEIQQRKIETRQDSVLDIMISTAVLTNNLPDKKLERFVEYFSNSSLFSYPGPFSYLRMAKLLQHFGCSEKASQFLREAQKRNVADYALQDYLKTREETYDSTSELSGRVLHQGRPLQGVKVRLFPMKLSQLTEEKKIEDIKRALANEKRQGIKDRKFFQHSTCSNYLILRDLYAITTTDASGRYSFSNLPPDEYRVVILLEGPCSSLRPAGSPGAARITGRGSHLTLPAIELQ